MNVAVLGCGPAGLLAAHAAQLYGHDVAVFSRKEKSIMPGAMFVHEPIPDICDPRGDALVDYVKLGDKRGYAAKVYGDPAAPCSWDLFPEGKVVGWNMRDMYDTLWDMFDQHIFQQIIDAQFLNAVVAGGRFDVVLSTVPAPVLCWGDHEFLKQPIWVDDEADPICEQWEDPVVVYNGQEEVDYYRTSKLFGYGSTEYGINGHNYPVWKGAKPLSTNCDCRPDITRLGRFGKWQKGVLVHHAFQGAIDAMQ